MAWFEWVVANQWAFDGILGAAIIAALSGIGTILLNRRRKQLVIPEPTRSVFKGNINGSRIGRVRARNAHHLVDGDVGRSRIEDIDFK
jgi:hypothetical protein